jgi:hypothetical protein
MKEPKSSTDPLHGSFEPEYIAMIDTPEGLKEKVPDNYGGVNCGCMHCRHPKVQAGHVVLNHGKFKHPHELGPREINRVSLVGDVDYNG